MHKIWKNVSMDVKDQCLWQAQGNLLWCYYNLWNCDMDYRIFNVCV